MENGSGGLKKTIAIKERMLLQKKIGMQAVKKGKGKERYKGCAGKDA